MTYTTISLFGRMSPQVYWPLLESDTMALVTERTAVKTAKSMREINREMLAREQQQLDALSAKSKWKLQPRSRP